MRQILRRISQGLSLPSLCILCNQFHKEKWAICSFCQDLMPPLGPCCQQCAHPLAATNYLKCGQCIKNPPPFDNAYISYPFEEPLRGLLHRFKYQQALYLGSFLSQLMSIAFPKEKITNSCLIPVPMHSSRIKQRGFNHAAVLARLLAKQFKLPFDLTSCKKIINTQPQASLNSQQRQSNLAHSFKVSPLPYSHVILIDDLLTTGSTAKELAKTLKKAGVERVDVCCCARTIWN